MNTPEIPSHDPETNALIPSAPETSLVLLPIPRPAEPEPLTPEEIMTRFIHSEGGTADLLDALEKAEPIEQGRMIQTILTQLTHRRYSAARADRLDQPAYKRKLLGVLKADPSLDGEGHEAKRDYSATRAILKQWFESAKPKLNKRAQRICDTFPLQTLARKLDYVDIQYCPPKKIALYLFHAINREKLHMQPADEELTSSSELDIGPIDDPQILSVGLLGAYYDAQLEALEFEERVTTPTAERVERLFQEALERQWEDHGDFLFHVRIHLQHLARIRELDWTRVENLFRRYGWDHAAEFFEKTGID